MKKLFLLPFCMSSFFVYAQGVNITFDDSVYKSLVFFDTITYHNNIWQVGKPHKAVFDTVYSLPNAIVTDTIHPYSISDTSVFTIKVSSYFWNPVGIFTPYVGELYFRYQLDIDSNAIARVEVSGNNGFTWRNILKDSTGIFIWQNGKPNFDTSTHGWQLFHASFPFLVNYFVVDSVQFRFTFISGNNDSNRDGWIIDNINVGYDVRESVPQTENNNIISIYPNPSCDELNIISTSKINYVAISDIVGKTLFNHQYNNEKVQIDVTDLPTGIYFIKINSSEIRKFIKE